RDLPRRLELEPGGTLLSGLHRARWIVRVRSRRIGPVQAVYGCGQQEVRAHLPLGADLMVGEPLRLQRAAGHVERAELVARAREIRDAVAPVDRHGLRR